MMNKSRIESFNNENGVRIKVLMLGDSNVGKSTMLEALCDKNYTFDSLKEQHRTSTVGIDFKAIQKVYANQIVKMQIWDTAGQERFKTITRSYYRGTQGIVLVYDVTNENSFNSIGKWIQDMSTAVMVYQIVITIVGNKSDMVSGRKISHEQGVALANEHGAKFFESNNIDRSTIVAIYDDMFNRICSMHLPNTNANNINIDNKRNGNNSDCCNF